VLERNGANATLPFDAASKDGIKMKGTVQCREVVEY